jgi:hypothetical protein
MTYWNWSEFSSEGDDHGIHLNFIICKGYSFFQEVWCNINL